MKQLTFCHKLLVRWHEITEVMFNIVVYITALTEVCVKFVHFVEISILVGKTADCTSYFVELTFGNANTFVALSSYIAVSFCNYRSTINDKG